MEPQSVSRQTFWIWGEPCFRATLPLLGQIFKVQGSTEPSKNDSKKGLWTRIVEKVPEIPETYRTVRQKSSPGILHWSQKATKNRLKSMPGPAPDPVWNPFWPLGCPGRCPGIKLLEKMSFVVPRRPTGAKKATKNRLQSMPAPLDPVWDPFWHFVAPGGFQVGARHQTAVKTCFWCPDDLETPSPATHSGCHLLGNFIRIKTATTGTFLRIPLFGQSLQLWVLNLRFLPYQIPIARWRLGAQRF